MKATRMVNSTELVAAVECCSRGLARARGAGVIAHPACGVPPTLSLVRPQFFRVSWFRGVLFRLIVCSVFSGVGAGRCLSYAAAQAPAEAQAPAAVEPNAADQELADDFVVGGRWLTEYSVARDRAKQNKQLLLIMFYDVRRAGLFDRLIERLLTDPDVVLLLRPLVKAKLPLEAATVSAAGETLVVVNHPAFRALGGQPGLALVDYRDTDGQKNYRVLSTYSLAGLPRDNIGSGPSIVSVLTEGGGSRRDWDLRESGREEWIDVDSLVSHQGLGDRSAFQLELVERRGVRRHGVSSDGSVRSVVRREAGGRVAGRFVASARFGLGLSW